MMLAQIQATRDALAKRHRVNLPLTVQSPPMRPVISWAGINSTLREAMANAGAKARAF